MHSPGSDLGFATMPYTSNLPSEDGGSSFLDIAGTQLLN